MVRLSILLYRSSIIDTTKKRRADIDSLPIRKKIKDEKKSIANMSVKPDDQYIRWDAEGVEVEQPGEKEKIWEVSEQFKRMQMMNFNEHHHCLRGTHLKTQGVSTDIE